MDEELNVLEEEAVMGDETEEEDVPEMDSMDEEDEE